MPNIIDILNGKVAYVPQNTIQQIAEEVKKEMDMIVIPEGEDVIAFTRAHGPGTYCTPFTGDKNWRELQYINPPCPDRNDYFANNIGRYGMPTESYQIDDNYGKLRYTTPFVVTYTKVKDCGTGKGEFWHGYFTRWEGVQATSSIFEFYAFLSSVGTIAGWFYNVNTMNLERILQRNKYGRIETKYLQLKSNYEFPSKGSSYERNVLYVYDIYIEAISESNFVLSFPTGSFVDAAYQNGIHVSPGEWYTVEQASLWTEYFDSALNKMVLNFDGNKFTVKKWERTV